MGRLARYEEYRAFYLGDQWMGGACARGEAGDAELREGVRG